MNQSKSRDRLTAIATVVIIILLALNAFLFYNKYHQDRRIEQQQAELTEAKQLHTELEKEYYEALSELEEMRSDNEELNNIIDSQQADLKERKERINRLLVDSRNLAKARRELAQLRKEVDKYVRRIKELNRENEQLAAANKQLEQEKQQLSEVIEEERREKEELASDREDLMSKAQNLQEEKKELAEKVNIASVINVKDIEVNGYKISNNGQFRQKDKAKHIDVLKICFRAQPNDVVENGMERFHIRIINPLGETIYNTGEGSGTTTYKVNEQPLRYTQLTDLEYQKQEIKTCEDWSMDRPWSPGTYLIKVYNKGYIAGETSFELE